MTLAEFKKIVAAWPDHEGDGAFDEDAQVWVETGFGLSSPVARVVQLNTHDMLIETNAFEEPTFPLPGPLSHLRCEVCGAPAFPVEAHVPCIRKLLNDRKAQSR